MIVGRDMDTFDTRVLGAIRIVDGATRAPVVRGLTLTAVTQGVRLWRNRRGEAVIAAAPGLAEHTTVFEAPPDAPPLGSVAVEIEIADPAGRYMSRRVTIDLPRDPDPNNAANEASIFRPIEVGLAAAAAARFESTWATVRVHVERTGAGPAAGALLRLTWTPDGGDPIQVQSLTDGRGEGVIPVPGVPSRTVDQAGTAATIRVVFDPALADGLPPGETPVIDPDLLAARDDAGDAALVTDEASLMLQAGRQDLRLSFEIAG